MKIIVRDTDQNTFTQSLETKEDISSLGADLNALLPQQKRQSIRTSTLKLFQKNQDTLKPIITSKGNHEQDNTISIISTQGNKNINQSNNSPTKTSILNRLFQKQTNNIRPSKVNFDDNKTQTSQRRFEINQEKIKADPLLNEFPQGMPKKHILYKELLQAYFNGEIQMNELIDLRNKYSMKKQKYVQLPLKDEDNIFGDQKEQKSNARLLQQIRSLRQKQITKTKQNEKKARGSILIPQISTQGMGLIRRDSYQSMLQSQNSISQTTLTRLDSKVDIMLQQIDEKDENNKIDGQLSGDRDQSSNKANNNLSVPVAQNKRRVTKFGSIILDKLLNIKDRVEHKKVIEMKNSKSNQNQFLNQFEEAQQEVIEKIKRGDLLQNDLSHKYYVKQFIERKNLNHLKILADKTSNIESFVAQKTIKKMNEDLKANKHKIFKEIEEAADDYLNKIQLKKQLLEQYSHKNTDKYGELEDLKNWRQQNTKKIMKEQKERHSSQYQFEKEQKDTVLEQKRQRLIKSRLMGNSMDSISYIQMKQENNTSTENLKSAYFSTSTKNQSSIPTNQSNGVQFNHNYFNSQPQKKEKNFPLDTIQSKSNLPQSMTFNGGLFSNTPNKNQNILYSQNQTSNTVLHVSRTSMTDTNQVLQSNRKTSQNLQNLQSQKPQKYNISSSETTQRKQNDRTVQLKNNQQFIEEYSNLNGTVSSNTTTSNSNKLNSLLSPQKVKGYQNSQNNNGIWPFHGFSKTVDFKSNTFNQLSQSSNNKKKSSMKNSKQNVELDEINKDNQKKAIQYLSNSKIINEHYRQNKPTIFLKEIYDLYSQEELYRNNSELRMRSKMHVSDKEDLSKFYKSEIEYKVIKRNIPNVTSNDRNNSLSKLDTDKSSSTLQGNHDLKQRVKSESNCLNSNKSNYFTNTISNSNNINTTIDADTIVDNNNNNTNTNQNNNMPEDSESGDSSLPSITEAQLDSLYSQSRHIQKMILKSKGNTQLFARRMKNVIKLKEINEGINKCIKMKLHHKSLNN